MPDRQQSSRGSHKRVRQMRMDLEASWGHPPDMKQERIKDNILTLFDDDYSVLHKALKDWIFESNEALLSYFKRPSKIEQVLKQKLGFVDGLKYGMNILLAELLIGNPSIDEAILEDLAPLVVQDLLPLLQENGYLNESISTNS